MRPIGITGTREISNLNRSQAVERPAEESAPAAARPVVAPSAPTEVPNLASTRSFLAAVDQTEAAWRSLLESDGELPSQQRSSNYIEPVQWPDIPPRDPASGDVLQPLRSRLVETLSPVLDELERISGEIENGRKQGLPVEDAVRRGLQGIQTLEAELSELVQSSVVEDLRTDPSRQPLVDEQFARAAARAVQPLIAEDPDRAARAMAGLDPSDVLSLVD